MLGQTGDKNGRADVAQRDKPAGEPDHDANSRIRLLALGLVVGSTYYFGALIGFALTLPNSAVSTLWPPNSILLAALLLTPSQRWWTVFLGAFPAHVIVQLQSGVPMSMLLAWFMSNCAEALIGAICVRRFISGPVDFASLKCLIVYLGFAVLLAPFLSSFLDAAFVVLVGWKGDTYWDVWLQRLPSNVLAALTIPSFILLWFDKGVFWLRSASLRRYGEGLFLICGSLVTGFFVFTWQVRGLGSTPALVYLPLPFLLWAAMRFGPTGASTLLLLLALGSIWGAAQGRGPFTSSSPAENVLSLQIFLIAISLPLMVLAGLVEERREKANAFIETEGRFRAIADTAPVMIWVSGTDKLCTFFSKGWLDFTGQTLEQELGNGWTKGVHPDDLDRCLRTYNGVLRQTA